MVAENTANYLHIPCVQNALFSIKWESVWNCLKKKLV